MTLPYIPQLASALSTTETSLFLPTLSSSYLGYGIGSLEKDADELLGLIQTLPSSRKVVVMGHSTGAQGAVSLLRRAKAQERVAGVILQAGISDADHYQYSEPRATEWIELAKTLPPDTLMPREADPCGLGNPITAFRFLSLAEKGGGDDFFGSQYSDDELKGLLGHISPPCLVLWSGSDEYVPAGVNGKELSRRIASAMPQGTCAYINEGKHNLEGKEVELAEHVRSFLQSVLGS
ncbi:unnamed protein product [Chrysoparadoxa australica]